MKEFALPIRIESEANLREHWSVKARRAKAQRATTHFILRPSLSCEFALLAKGGTLTVTLTRIAPRKLDGDNLQRGFKAVRDQIAACLGVDDGSEAVTWLYAQEKGKPREYAARVTVA